jgi:hypothetical protein
MAGATKKGSSSRRGSKSQSRSTARPGSKARTGSRAKSGDQRGRTRGATSKQTTDHEEIRRWVEERGGKPACVRGTGGKGDPGLLRIDMPGYTGEDTLAPISWDEWFEKFDEQGLAFLYQDKTAGGKKSNFNKLVKRDSVK